MVLPRPGSSTLKTSGQLADNFGTLYSGLTLAQSSNADANDYVFVGRPTVGIGTTRAALVYDTTAADDVVTKTTFTLTPGRPGVTISADARFTTATASFGYYFINASNRQQAFMSLFNVDASGGLDNIRFTGATAPGYVNPTSSASTETGLSLSAASNADAGVTLNELKNISTTYRLNASGQVVMSMTAGTRTLEGAPITTLAGFSEIEVGLRVSPAGGVNDYAHFDNVNVSVVPEPASLGLLSLAGLGLFRRRHA